MNRRELPDLGAELARKPGKGRPDDARIGLTVRRRQRGADDARPKPGQLVAHRIGAEQRQLQAMLARALGVTLQLRHVGFGTRELDVPARLELDILAELAAEIVPQDSRTPRERQFGEMTALLAHAAEIDAAGASAAETLFQHRHREPRLAQRHRGGAGGNSAADDRDIDHKTLAHGRPPTGIGLIGGLLRRRPTAATSVA